MDFLRKLFPLIKRKNMVADTNKTNDINHTELPLVQNSSQLHTNDYPTEDDNAESDCNKILCTLENVDPLIIYPNITQVESKDIEGDIPECNGINKILCTLENVDPLIIYSNIAQHESKDIEGDIPECNGINNTIEQINSLNDVTSATNSNNDNHTNEGIEKENISLGTPTLNDITLDTVTDDKTLQNLREFEETLNTFNKNACLSNFSAEQLIDLDEFNEIFDKLDEDLNDQISSERNAIEDESACCRDSAKNITDTEKDSKIQENVDVISINSSTDDERNLSNDTQDVISINSDSKEALSSEYEGYHSSDFEFISEAEANMDGFIINFRSKMNQEIEKSSQESTEDLSLFFREALEDIEDNENSLDPGAGPSGLNRKIHEFADRSYRNNHVIPAGDDYLGLFQGIYNPVLPVSEIFFLENKSVRTSAMNAQYDGIGFDKQLALRRPQPDSSEDEFGDDAKQCAKKILNMYPGENRKRRRLY